MNARRSALLLAAALLAALPAAATQKTPAQLSTQVQSNFPDNKIGAITPKILRDTTQDIVDSFAPLSSLVIACPSSQWIQSIATGGVSTCAQIGFSNLSGSISPTQIPYPSLTSIGGVMAVNPVANQFVTSINTSGVPLLAQPAFSDLSGTIAASQLIAPGASTFGAVKSSSAGANQFATGINTSGVVTYAQPAFSNLSGSIAASQLIAPGASALGGVKSSTAGANQFATGIDTSGAVTYAQPTIGNISGAFPYATGAAGTGANATATTFGSASQALYLSGNLTGTGTGPYALISVTDTSTNNVAAGFTDALWVAHNIGPSAGEGSRAAFRPILTLANPLPCTTSTTCFHIASFPQAYVTANMGGTNVSAPNNYKGDIYGAGAIAQAGSGATYLHGIIGQETNVSVQTGASVAYKSIASLISVNSDAVGGATHNSMLVFTADNTTTYRWPLGISFGREDSSWPFNSSSTLIGTSVPGTGSRVANWFLDGANITYTSGFIRSTGFSVGPSGATTVSTLTATSTISTTGAGGAFVAVSRTGSGNSYLWYNPTGAGLKLSDGGSDLLSITSTGGVYAGAEIAPASTVVGSLGTCNAGTRGALKVVTDGAAALAWGATQTGGASAVYLSFCNGAAWTVAAK